MLSSNSRYFPGFLKGYVPYYIYPRGFFPSSQIELEHMLPLLCLDKQCCLTGSILGVFKVIMQHTSRIRSFSNQQFFLMVLIKSWQKRLYTFRFTFINNIWSANVPMWWNQLATAHFTSFPGFHHMNGTFSVSPSWPIQKGYLVFEKKHNIPQVGLGFTNYHFWQSQNNSLCPKKGCSQVLFAYRSPCTSCPPQCLSACLRILSTRPLSTATSCCSHRAPRLSCSWRNTCLEFIHCRA